MDLRFAIASLVIVLPAFARAENACLQQRWIAPLNLCSPTNVVVGRLDGEARLCVQGMRLDVPPSSAGIELLDAKGQRGWQAAYAGDRGTGIGAYVQWIDAGVSDPVIAYSFQPADAALPGGVRIVRASDGALVKQLTNVTHFGNNNSLIIDLTGDDVPEFVYADQETLTAYSVADYSVLWQYAGGINFCWSLPAATDLDGDGSPEIVFGSEYNNEDASSSMIALDNRGERVWRVDGFAEDLGSTPVFIADADGDGAAELIKVGLDLEHRRGRAWNHIHVFGRDGTLMHQIPFGSTGVALGDIDGDGHLEGVGLSNTRDGGNNGRKQICCVDLITGEQDWSVEVPRAYLDCNSPVMADVDGDGALEAIVGTGNPSGYARLPNSEPWGDLYFVGASGEIKQHIALPGWPVNTAFCDIDDDGRGELLVVLDGQPGSLTCYSTQARTDRRDWPTPFGDAARQGTMAVR